jgi:hypothetical protein
VITSAQRTPILADGQVQFAASDFWVGIQDQHALATAGLHREQLARGVRKIRTDGLSPLKEHGIDPSPDRTSDSWADFLTLLPPFQSDRQVHVNLTVAVLGVNVVVDDVSHHMAEFSSAPRSNTSPRVYRFHEQIASTFP